MSTFAEATGASSATFVRFRTFILVAVPLAFPLLYNLVIAPSRQERSLMSEARRNAEVTTLIFAANAVAPVNFEDAAGLERLLKTANKNEDIKYAAGYNKDGKLLAAYGTAPTDSTEVSDALQVSEGTRVLLITAPVKKDGQLLGSVKVAFSTENLADQVTNFRVEGILLALVVLSLAAAMAYILGRGFGRLFDQLRGSILKSAKRIDEVVNQLAAVTAEQTAAASEESSALNESEATASDVANAARSSAQRATALIDGGSRAEEGATQGLEAVGSATEAMTQVREQVSQNASAMSALSERAAAINDIASTVALLAERTNLLALNAAIEAARAGTQGRGFSVVAQEMRSLADGSNRSAGQVKTIVGEIQSAIGRALGDAKEGERRVENAEQMSERAAQSIRRFADTTREFALVGKEIAAAANQQNVAIDQMVESIRHATEAGHTQLETTRQVEDTTRQLRQLSRELLAALAGNASARADLDGPPV